MKESATAKKHGNAAITPAEFRCLREQLGLTENWLAARWNVAKQSVIRWERNRELPQQLAEDIAEIKNSFDASVSKLSQKYKAGDTLTIPATRDNDDVASMARYPQRMVRAIAWAVHEKTGCKIAYPDGAWEGKYES